MVVELISRQIWQRDEPEQVLRGGVQHAGRNLVARERLAGCGIEQLDCAGGEVAGPHGGCGNRCVLIEGVVRSVARVIHLKIRPAVRVLVEARNFQRAAEGRPERVLSKLRLRGGNHGIELIGRRVERRATERISRRPLVRTLAARGTAGQEKAARAPATAAGSAAAAELTRGRRAAVRTRHRGCRRAEALRELPGGGIELPQRDRLRAIVDQPAVEAGRVAAAGDRDGVGLRRLQRKSRREQAGGIGGFIAGHADRCVSGGLRLDGECLKSSAPPRVSQRRRLALATRGKLKLDVDRRVARRRAEGDRAFDGRERRQFDGDTIAGARGEGEREAAVDISRGRGLQGVPGVHDDGGARQRPRGRS